MEVWDDHLDHLVLVLADAQGPSIPVARIKFPASAPDVRENIRGSQLRVRPLPRRAARKQNFDLLPTRPDDGNPGRPGASNGGFLSASARKSFYRKSAGSTALRRGRRLSGNLWSHSSPRQPAETAWPQPMSFCQIFDLRRLFNKGKGGSRCLSEPSALLAGGPNAM